MAASKSMWPKRKSLQGTTNSFYCFCSIACPRANLSQPADLYIRNTTIHEQLHVTGPAQLSQQDFIRDKFPCFLQPCVIPYFVYLSILSNASLSSLLTPFRLHP